MSVNKYANLPDIDTSQDIYETEDTFPTRSGKGDSSDEESGVPSRPAVNGARGGKSGDAEGLDASHLLSTEEAGKKFRKAERKRGDRSRSIFSYPPSTPPSPTSSHSRPLATRLRALQAELDSLEAELSDPSNPLLQDDIQSDGNHVDPGALMRGLVDVRGRLEKVKKGKEGRERLVGVILGQDKAEFSGSRYKDSKASERKGKEATKDAEDSVGAAELDRRVSELEDLIGSSSITLDETSPLPAPLLPMLTKLNTQLTVLTQPRHLDSISRRLKLLISDLDRLSSAQQAQGNRRQQHQGQAHAPPAAPSPLQEQLLPLLARLAPHLPHLPHMLTRMRTLSTLHAAAADFQGSLGTLEEEQIRVRGRLDVLSKAVEGVEKSLEDNATVVKANVGGLEERVDILMKRLDALG